MMQKEIERRQDVKEDARKKFNEAQTEVKKFIWTITRLFDTGEIHKHPEFARFGRGFFADILNEEGEVRDTYDYKRFYPKLRMELMLSDEPIPPLEIPVFS